MIHHRAPLVFADARLAQLSGTAALASRRLGGGLHEDACVAKQTIKVSESSLTL